MKAWVKSTGGQKTALIYARTTNGDKIVNVNNKMNNWTEVTLTDIEVTNGTVQLGIYSDANAGNWLMVDDITLIGNVQPIEKIPDGKYIKSLTINDSDNSADWSIQQGLDSGTEVFGDRQCKFTAVPEQLKNAEWIRTACDSKKFTGEEASFIAGADITAFVGIDTRAESNASSWLSSWTKTDLTLTDDGNPIVTYNIYKKDVKNGETITLGEVNMNNAVNYVVLAKEYEAVTTTTTTTIATTTETTTTVSLDFILGDINDDKRVDVFDMVLMRRALIEPLSDAREKLAADMNGNGTIDISDAVLLQKFLLGIK